jgi:phospholipase D1/2
MDFIHKLEDKVGHLFGGEEEGERHDEPPRPQEVRPQEQHEDRPPSPPHHKKDEEPPVNTNRFQSFAPPSSGNVKWHVDGASYFYAVSLALERGFGHAILLQRSWIF